MDNFIVFFLVVFIIFCLFMGIRDHDKKVEQEMNGARNKLAALIDSQGQVKKFENILRDGSGVAGDEEGNLYILRRGVAAPVRVPGNQIAEVSLVVNNVTEAKTVNKGGLTRAVVGGVTFGSTGAVVGALTSKSKTISIEKINEVKVEVFVTADGGFTYEHVLLSRGAQIPTDEVKRIISQAKVLKTQIDNLVNLSNLKKLESPVLEDAPPAHTVDKNDGVDVNDKFDKLKKLGDLYKSGLLTEEEFLSEKSKLLES